MLSGFRNFTVAAVVLNHVYRGVAGKSGSERQAAPVLHSGA